MLRHETKIGMLVAVSALLLLAIALGSVFGPEAAVERAFSGVLLADAAGIDSILVTGREDYSLELEEDGAWVMRFSDTKRPVRGARVVDFLDKIAAIRSLVPVSSEPADRARFGLADDPTRIVVKRSGAVLLDMYVGSYGPTGQEIYVRREGDDAVHSVDGAFASYSVPGRIPWLDLSLPSIPFEDVVSLSISSRIAFADYDPGALSYTIVRGEAGWGFEDGNAGIVDTVIADMLVRSCLALSGNDFADEKAASEALARAAFTATLTLKNGRRITLDIAPTAEPARFFVQRSDSPYAVMVQDWFVKSLAKTEYELSGGE